MWFPETTQIDLIILAKKRCGWYFKAIIHEGRSGIYVETDAGGDKKLTFKFVWPINVETS